MSFSTQSRQSPLQPVRENPFNPGTVIVSTPSGPAIIPKDSVIHTDSQGRVIAYEDTKRQQTVLVTPPSTQTSTQNSYTQQTSRTQQTVQQTSTAQSVQTTSQVAEKIYESAKPQEKVLLHAHTFLSSKGWEYALSALPDFVEGPIRSGIKTIGEKLGSWDIFGFSKIDTKPKTPEQVVKERIHEMITEEKHILTKPKHEQFLYYGLQGLASPAGVIGIESTANIIGGKLISKLGTSAAKKFVGIGGAGIFEGGVSTAAISATEAYKQTGDIKAAAIAAAVGGAIGGSLGFFSAGSLGALYPLSQTTKGKVGKGVVNTVAYALDFPGEPLGDLFTYTTTKVIKTPVITPTPVITNVFGFSITPSQSQSPTQTSTQTNIPTKISTTNVPTQVPTPTPTLTPTFTPSKVPSNIPDIFVPTPSQTYTPTTNTPSNVPTITPTVVPTPKIPLLPFLPLPLKEGQGREKYDVKVKSKFVDEAALMRKIISSTFL
ncbi:MAG: hypothetical protein QXY78_04260 [Thermoplasmata archaeon]